MIAGTESDVSTDVIVERMSSLWPEIDGFEPNKALILENRAILWIKSELILSD